MENNTLSSRKVKEQLKAALQHFKNLAAKASLDYILTFNGLF
jgi:hypothetical protein